MKRLPKILGIILSFVLCFGVFAACAADDCRVVFDLNTSIVNVDDESNITNAPDPVTVKSGEKVTKPTNPAWSGYEFGGWFKDADCEGAEYDFSTPVTANLRLYAKWSVAITYYTVTFNLNYTSSTPSTEQVASGATINAPTDPVRSGYIFGGWYLDEDCVTAYSFSATVSESFTLFAKWHEAYTITYNYNYTSAPAAVDVAVIKGVAPNRPSNPTRAEYAFAGWFKDAACTQIFGFVAGTANLTVYAKWIATSSTTFNVTYNFNYTQAPSNVVKATVSGAVVDPIENPTQTGKIFVGWYTAATDGALFDFDAPITANVTIYAHWADSYNFTIDLNYSGAAAPTVTQVEPLSTITQPASPSRTGYTFAGWAISATGLVGSVTFPLTISGDTTIYAQWSNVHIFEAEDVDFTDFAGFGFSGSAIGTSAICYGERALTANPSNGRFVSYMYVENIKLTFNFKSDRAVSGVKLVWRLSAEIKDITIQATGNPSVDGVFKIKVNGTEIDYGSISFEGVPGQDEDVYLEFFDYLVGMVDLLEGDNVIELITANDVGMGGTMWATAPMIDCLKLETYAKLTFTPVSGNY